MTHREKEILSLIEKNPMISQNEIADYLGIARSSVSIHIGNMMKKGLIQGRGYIVSSDHYSLIIGALTLDLVGIVNSFATPDYFNDDSNISMTYGGNGKLIAENLYRLGEEVQLISAVGDDVWSQEAINNCRANGILTESCLKVSGQTPSIYIELQNDQHENYVGLGNVSLQLKITPEYLETKSRLISNAQNVCVDDGLSPESFSYLGNKFGEEVELFLFAKNKSRCERYRKVLNRFTSVFMNKDVGENYFFNGKKKNAEDIIVKALQQGTKSIYIYDEKQHRLYYSEKDGEIWCADSGRQGRNGNYRGVTMAMMASIVKYHFVDSVNERLSYILSAHDLTCETDYLTNVNLNEAAIMAYVENQYQNKVHVL